MRALRRAQALEAGKPKTARRLMAASAVFAFGLLASIAGSPIQLITATPAAAQQTPKSAFAKPKNGIFGKTQKFDGGLPLHLQADELVYDSEGSKVIAKGNVEIQYENNNLTADEVIYDQAANTLSAQGNVVLRDANGNIVRAERYTLTDDFRDGFVQSLSVVAVDDSKISAEQGIRRDGNVTEFKNAKFTPCRTDGSQPPLWCIAASTVTHDQAAQTISYQDAQFEMFGVPIFGLPYFEHPDPTVKRKSGFLAPDIGSSGDLGFFTEIPYYFALSPSYDFTFHPRYMTGQGVLWMGDWRQRFANGQYSVKLAGIDQDGSDLDVDPAKQQDLDGFRGSIVTRGDFSLASWWRAGWDVTLETDDTFRRFYKLDSILLTDRVNNLYFTGMSDRNYFATNLYQFGGLLLDDTAQSESRVHPVIDYNYIVDAPVVGGELSIAGNALSLSRSDGLLGTSDQEMSRASMEVKWRRRLTDQMGITYTPFGELRGDLLQVNNYRDAETGLAVDDDTVARGLASGGVTVAYPWIASTAGASHIIEPIGQIITRTANVDQREFPVEDAKSLVFDDTNLFDTNKFSGWDRLETGTRANVGLQYTFQPWTGGHARVLAGQSYQLDGQNPYANRAIPCDPDGAGPQPESIVRAAGVDDNCNPVFSPNSGLETSTSDYVLGAYIAPTDNFRLISQSRFNDDDFTLKREDATLAVNYGPLSMAATYTYSFADPEFGTRAEQDVSALFGLRLTDRWSLLGGLRYDLDESQFITDTATIRYQDDCFMLSVTYDEYHIRDEARDIEPDQTVMFRIEYKYLGGFNYKSNVLDYVNSDQQPPG
ncbi:MAG: LPS-assembly protein LptD [Hyphomicrobium sp.]|nr:LPS-assembly protein LptD [Hyphomicrobium sp.]PPD08289.1 MAG: organic solvent tolerance protein [Hyphomicrobium sp.]